MENRFGRIGIVLAAAGSAVGLGNIWKFPYMIGENGGGAFLIVYILCILVFGVPVMSAEFYAGREGMKRWPWLKHLMVLSTTLFFGFYTVVMGWCLEALGNSIGIHGIINEVWMLIGIVMTAAIEWAGVKKGIERTVKVMMPILFILLLVIGIRGLMMKGSWEGVRFLWEADFSKITPTLVLNAMGQCFFSLSIGVGALATYARYMQGEQNLPRTATEVICMDTAVAILAGMAIFPAVFALGMDPTEGPKLVFEVLPVVFDGMRGGEIIRVLFFLLLSTAALTSTISLMEVQTSYAEEQWGVKRHNGIAGASVAVFILAVAANHSTLMLNWMDLLVSNYLLPAGGLLFALYVGWRCDKNEVKQALLPYPTGQKVSLLLYNLIRWVVPPMIALIFMDGIGLL